MTNYDKQKTRELINSLSRLLEAKKSSMDTSKFKFKGAPIILQTDNSPTKNLNIQVGPKPYMENIFDQRIEIQSPVNHLLLKQFERCIVLNHKNSSSVNLQTGANSILRFDIDGTISATGLTNCIVLANCHQLRLHNITNSLVVSDITTNVIMENCMNVKFSGAVNVDDFNFNFTNSQNYSYVEIERESLDWINGQYDADLLQQTLGLIHDCS
ncbi:hypothetical protein CANTEDRAFT_92076 [Yamadazyma tenuis ATCC 10573]|uniref:Tubulin binding cofactor C-like domain-containing protein n=2 Tax=Candida tenuis TaxID=2315449 RepID=G3AY18_CANTC|nr:uncharacterized protein CANTEDRAFT_92076 [Yamadazyma tenuis ATCC 10573]EGV65750.1 hypothetical protein CANTEDRAFT_92076 [Yamadazyma tenuis ATCC 10573]